MASEDVPSAVTAVCPNCGEETLQSVLRGRVGSSGGMETLDATVQCVSCSHTHHLLQRAAKDIEVPVVVSHGPTSRRTKIALPGDDDITLEEGLIVDGVTCRITGIESKEQKRVDAATVKEVLTLWVKEFEEIAVGFAINLDQKTITKVIPASPETEFSIGQEFVFGRLRVTVHGIKTNERMITRGSAEAGEIVRVFAKPTPLGDFKPRPDKRTREQLREREERREARREARRRG